MRRFWLLVQRVTAQQMRKLSFKHQQMWRLSIWSKISMNLSANFQKNSGKWNKTSLCLIQRVYSYDQQGTTACCTILLADIIVGSWEKGMHQNTSFNPSFADTSEHTVSSYYTASGAPSILSHCHHPGKERAKNQTQTPSSEKKDENFCKSRHSSLMCLITLMLLYHITPNCTWRWCIPMTR